MGKHVGNLAVKVIEILEVKRTNTMLLVEDRYGTQFKCRLTNKRTIIGYKNNDPLIYEWNHKKSKPIYEYEQFAENEIEINKVYWITGNFYTDKTSECGYYLQGYSIRYAPRLTKWLNKYGTFLNIVKRPDYKNRDIICKDNKVNYRNTKTTILLNQILLNLITQTNSIVSYGNYEMLGVLYHLTKQLEIDGWSFEFEENFDTSLDKAFADAIEIYENFYNPHEDQYEGIVELMSYRDCSYPF